VPAAAAWQPARGRVSLDVASGADGHCQVNARVRLVQEACGWMDDTFRGQS